MVSKREQLKETVDSLVHSSADIVGTAVVSNDGLLLANALSENIERNRLAAVSVGYWVWY